MRRIYMDLLRLEVGPAFQYVPPANVLHRQTLKDANGADIYVYYRQGQRRARAETDGTFCMTQDETGLQFPAGQQGTGTAMNVSQDVLDTYTRRVKPWWLYRDYTQANPTGVYSASEWTASVPGFVPTPGLLTEADKKTPSVEVRVCAEEASTLETGTIYASGRTTRPPAPTPPPAGRLDFPPLDSTYATANAGRPVSCSNG